MTNGSARTSLYASPTPVSETVPPDLVRLAHCVASGTVSFPMDLPPYETGLLARLVREILRDRLVGHIAHAIAEDIVASAPSKETPC